MLDVIPADEYILYDAPVEVVKTVGASGTFTVLVSEDPTRVELIIGLTQASSAANAGVTTVPTGSGSTGLRITTPLMFSYKFSPRLCQAAWWVAGNAGGGQVYAVSVSLRRPPVVYGYADLFKDAKGRSVATARPRAAAKSLQAAKVKIPAALLQSLRARCPNVFQRGE